MKKVLLLLTTLILLIPLTVKADSKVTVCQYDTNTEVIKAWYPDHLTNETKQLLLYFQINEDSDATKAEIKKINYTFDDEKVISYYNSKPKTIGPCYSYLVIEEGTAQFYTSEEFKENVNSITGEVYESTRIYATNANLEEVEYPNDENASWNDEYEGDLDFSKICHKGYVPRVLQFLGILLFVAKILVPFLIIAFGIMDLFKVITSGKDDQIRSSAGVLLKRFIIGVIIFFIPSFVNFFLGAIDGFDETKSEYANCWTCILEPSNCTK